MSDEKDPKRGRGGWATWLAVAFVLLLLVFVVSVGPALRLAINGHLEVEVGGCASDSGRRQAWPAECPRARVGGEEKGGRHVRGAEGPEAERDGLADVGGGGAGAAGAVRAEHGASPPAGRHHGERAGVERLRRGLRAAV